MMVNSFVVVPPVESVTLTVIVVVAAAVGVPEITPAGFRDIPSGSGFDPAFKLHTYSGTPPEAANVWLYATPTVPPERDVVVIVGAAGGGGGGGGGVTPTISSVNVFVLLVPVESVTLRVIVFVSAVAGIPEMTPDGFNVNPAGSGFDPVLRLHT